jgi:hypothetical protein
LGGCDNIVSGILGRSKSGFFRSEKVNALRSPSNAVVVAFPGTEVVFHLAIRAAGGTVAKEKEYKLVFFKQRPNRASEGLVGW